VGKWTGDWVSGGGGLRAGGGEDCGDEGCSGVFFCGVWGS
jgi:hypothetical protein